MQSTSAERLRLDRVGGARLVCPATTTNGPTCVGELIAVFRRILTKHLTAALAIAGVALSGAGAAADPKREVPDYDGRGNPDADNDAWWVWIPRTVLSPFYLVTEYGVRRPMGWLVRRAERDNWADTITSIFTFGEDNKSIIYPTALFDFGLLPSVGLYYASEDLGATGNVLRAHVATWGKPWLVATIADRYAIDAANMVQVRADFRRAEDNLFFGIGPDVRKTTRSRYGLERLEGNASFRHLFTRESRVELHTGVHRISFVDGTCCNDPELSDLIRDGAVMAPPGFGEAYTTAFGSLDLTLDTRDPRPAPGSGAFLHVWTSPNVDLHRSRVWAQYGGALGAAVDLTGHQRILKMQVATSFVDSVSDAEIPFTEYVSLGGDLMAGFVPAWMVGRSTAAAQLGYSWPVWIGVDAQTRVAVGNAFGKHLDGLTPAHLRWSWDIGLATTTLRDQGLELLFGLGSETFEHGAGITSVRVAVGSRQGF